MQLTYKLFGRHVRIYWWWDPKKDYWWNFMIAALGWFTK